MSPYFTIQILHCLELTEKWETEQNDLQRPDCEISEFLRGCESYLHEYFQNIKQSIHRDRNNFSSEFSYSSFSIPFPMNKMLSSCFHWNDIIKAFCLVQYGIDGFQLDVFMICMWFNVNFEQIFFKSCLDYLVLGLFLASFPSHHTFQLYALVETERNFLWTCCIKNFVFFYVMLAGSYM